MADTNNNNDAQPQQVVIAQPVGQVPGPTEGNLQPVAPSNDPDKKPTYIVNGVEVDPDGNPVGKGKGSK